MGLNLAMDIGGSKVIAILYDEKFCPIAVSRVGSLREVVTPSEKIDRNFETLCKDLGITATTEINYISGCLEKEVIERFQKLCKVRETDFLSEATIAYSAAGLFGDAINVISGTGSSCCIQYNGRFIECGGHGAIVADFGSGYWIGRKAIQAAILDAEEVGSNTVLTEYIAQHFGYERDEISEAIRSIYKIKHKSPVECVASCTPLVSKAADEGDIVAKDILISAGEIMGKRTINLIQRESIPDSVPLTISGSVWKGSKILFNTFCDIIKEQSPSRPIKPILFEPIIGIMIKRFYDLKGDFTKEDCEYFKRLYPEYIINFSI